MSLNIQNTSALSKLNFPVLCNLDFLSMDNIEMLLEYFEVSCLKATLNTDLLLLLVMFQLHMSS